MKIFKKLSKMNPQGRTRQFLLSLLGMGLVSLGVAIWIISSFGNLFSLNYVRGHGGYGMPLMGLIIGIIFLYHGLRGLLIKEK